MRRKTRTKVKKWLKITGIIVGVILLIQIIILTTGLSKLFIVSGIKLWYVFITIIICIFTFVIGEFMKSMYVKLFKDYIEEEK